jgi:hypothetical protein
MITDRERRWTDRRASWAPQHTLFDPAHHSVEVIPERVAKPFIIQHHYSGTYPAARFRAGLFDQQELVGVAVFSVPASQKVLTRYADIEPVEGVELGRLVLLERCAYNAETWFLARAFKLLKRALGSRFVLSYSDPIPRHDAGGRLVKPGHIGQIYQALNGLYFGRASRSTLLILPSGKVMSPRALGKIRRGERGRRYATEQLIKGGAPAPLKGESGESYVQRVSGHFTKLRHPGNLAYGWCLDKRVNSALKLPALPDLKMI